MATVNATAGKFQNSGANNDFIQYLAPTGQIVYSVDSTGAVHSANTLISPPGNLYVVGNANDTNLAYLQNKFGGITYADGSTMFQSTLQAAINACVDLRGDVILVGPRTTVVSTPILLNKKGIMVSALYNIGSNEDSGERFLFNADATPDIPCFIISEPCTVSGLGFDSANTKNGTGLVGGAISLGPGSGFDGGNFVTIQNCRFENFGAANHAIDSQYNDYVKIINCDFDGTNNAVSGGANEFASGISIIQGHFVTVENCTFRGCTYAILHGTPNPASSTHSNQNFIYKANRVMVSGGTEKFINFNTLATYSLSYGLVADNWLGTATDTASYNDTVANAKTGKVTFSGNHYAE